MTGLTKEETEGLLHLSAKRILTPSAIVLYLFYKTHDGEKHGLTEIRRATGVCTRTIREITRLLTLVRLVNIVDRDPKRYGGKYRTRIYPPTHKYLKQVISEKAMINEAKRYKHWLYREHNERNKLRRK